MISYDTKSTIMGRLLKKEGFSGYKDVTVSTYHKETYLSLIHTDAELAITVIMIIYRIMNINVFHPRGEWPFWGKCLA